MKFQFSFVNPLKILKIFSARREAPRRCLLGFWRNWQLLGNFKGKNRKNLNFFLCFPWVSPASPAKSFNPLRTFFYWWFFEKMFIRFFDNIGKNLSVTEISASKLISTPRTVHSKFWSPVITAVFTNFNMIYFKLDFLGHH